MKNSIHQSRIRPQDSLFIKRVLAHHKKHGRHDLVWRKKITPYKILVSEIMLQQTQVSRVKEKFILWMKTYPTLTSLSRGDLREVLILWQGLGYQRRVKALYDIAKKEKQVPVSFEKLLELPGVGTYTASAVCAFAYNTFAHPLLETNIRTALIETFHKRETSVSDEELFHDLARLEKNPAVKKVGARTWYYALMDFGAYLKANKISHNTKVKGNRKQSPYKGSLRELRAKTLFAITHKQKLPEDVRLEKVVDALIRERYIEKRGRTYQIT
jgi:A/G-specific adenine glycosylase